MKAGEIASFGFTFFWSKFPSNGLDGFYYDLVVNLLIRFPNLLIFIF